MNNDQNNPLTLRADTSVFVMVARALRDDAAKAKSAARQRAAQEERETKLPNKIYLIDPFDDDGQPVENTGDVCWCADPAGDVNVAYIAEALVVAALEKLRAKLQKQADARIDFPDTSHAYDIEFERRLGIRAAIREIDTTIAALGLSNRRKRNDR